MQQPNNNIKENNIPTIIFVKIIVIFLLPWLVIFIIGFIVYYFDHFFVMLAQNADGPTFKDLIKLVNELEPIYSETSELLDKIDKSPGFIECFFTFFILPTLAFRFIFYLIFYFILAVKFILKLLGF